MTYQIEKLPTKEEKERARRLRKAAKKRHFVARVAKQQAKLEKLVETRKAYAERVKTRLLALDAEILRLNHLLGEEK